MSKISLCKKLFVGDIVRINNGKYIGKLGQITKGKFVCVRSVDFWFRRGNVRIEGVHLPISYGERFPASSLDLYMRNEDAVLQNFFLKWLNPDE